jgi:transposase
VQQYYLAEGQLQWRTAQQHGLAPAALAIQSPTDTEARYSEKRSTSWVGYKAHLTETCDQDQPRLITQVETTVATTPDHQVLDSVHQQLAAKELLPTEHVVDAGYVTADTLVGSQQDYGVELCGPVRSDTAWQARAEKGFAASDFSFEWSRQQARCPAGQLSRSWQETTDRYGQGQIKIKFSVRDCRPCWRRADCTRSERRILTIRPAEEFLALEQARARQQTPEYAKLYATRAGIEGSLSQAVRRCDLRQARYVGLPKTHLQNLLTAAAINVVRVINWLAGVPLAKTRRSSFSKLMQAEPLLC